jgi:hypothetical protein
MGRWVPKRTNKARFRLAQGSVHKRCRMTQYGMIISNGPSKFDLLLALFDRGPNQGFDRLITFDLTLIEKLPPAKGCQMGKMDHDKLEVQIMEIGKGKGVDDWTIVVRNKEGQLLKGNYSTQNRSGSLAIV